MIVSILLVLIIAGFIAGIFVARNNANKINRAVEDAVAAEACENDNLPKNADSPDIMVFKSSEAAFEMSSKYMINNLAPNELVLAIVLSELDADRNCIVKLANRENPSIPSYPVTDINDLPNDGTICTHATALDAIKNLKAGDLVMYTPDAAIGMLGGPLHMSGFLVGKIKPMFSNKEQIWIADNT